MKTSVIIPYRDRKEHLLKLLDQFEKLNVFPNSEIIVVEQNDQEKFRKSSLLNVGAVNSAGDILVFHDVDYLPSDDKSYAGYSRPLDDVFLPVRKATFVDMKLNERPVEEIPSGYRHFKDAVDDNFFGGVVIMSKNHFGMINGFNPLFIGWGLEDADIKKRLDNCKIEYERGNGHFFALPHEDSHPGADDKCFQSNNQIYAISEQVQQRYGHNDFSADLEIKTELNEHGHRFVHILASNFKVNT